MAQFVGIIHKDKKNAYGVSFPDFPGCISAGRTLQEAYEMGKEALRGHIETMQDYGDALPKRPMTLDAAQTHAFAENAFTFFMVDAYMPSRARRINVTMDGNLIAAIDAVSTNRSAFLEEAAKEKLHLR